MCATISDASAPARGAHRWTAVRCPHEPYHFTVVGDLHIALDGVFVHRTELLPPLDDIGVTPAAAFIQYCASARMIDAVVVGDWLLHRGHMTLIEVAELARRDAWRPGASQVRRVLPLLEPASRSIKESETRVLVVFAGLPIPESNVDLVIGGRWLGCVDLLLRPWLLGYDGGPPVFANRWASLFLPITSAPGGAPASKNRRKVDASAPRRGRGGR